MSKRKISKQQKFRIKKLQMLSLSRAKKKTGANALTLDNQELGEEQIGLLITYHGKYVDIEGADGQTYRCHLRQNLGNLIAGDHVIWRASQNHTGIVVAVCQRKSLFWRPDEKGEKKPMAANIDQIIIVFAPLPKVSMLLIDSYLIAAATLNIKAVLLLNKIDIIKEADKAHLQRLLMIYGNIGYQVVLASSKTSSGLLSLKLILKNHSSIFVGQSGVGKSTLIKNLIPSMDITTAQVSVQSGLGVHTTTRSHLYHLPLGGDLIDSPGIREFALWHMTPKAIASGFVEFNEYQNCCKFNDCLHFNEPGCAILKAVHEGKIAKERFENYLAIVKNLENRKFFYFDEK